MTYIMRFLLGIFMLTAMAVPMSAAEPLKLMTAPETPKYLAYINSWKPELPVLTPVEAIEEYKTPQMVLDMISHAKEFMGLRYRRGGKTPKGFDCSGFTGYIFKQFGISLKASSNSQYTQGTPVVTDDLRPGDLVFFNGRRAGTSRVGHVGMVVDVDAEAGTFKFIHSAISSGITISDSSEPYYSRRYIGARRVIDESSLN